MRILLIDDVRTESSPSVGRKVDLIARNYGEGLDALITKGPWDLLLLDHDLASFDDYGKECTGYTVMCFLEENPDLLPGKIEIVSSNPVGRNRIQAVIDKLYRKEEK